MVIVWWDYEGLEHQETYNIGDAKSIFRLGEMASHGIRFSVMYHQCAPYPQHEFE